MTIIDAADVDDAVDLIREFLDYAEKCIIAGDGLIALSHLRYVRDHGLADLDRLTSRPAAKIKPRGFWWTDSYEPRIKAETPEQAAELIMAVRSSEVSIPVSDAELAAREMLGYSGQLTS